MSNNGCCGYQKGCPDCGCMMKNHDRGCGHCGKYESYKQNEGTCPSCKCCGCCDCD